MGQVNKLVANRGIATAMEILCSCARAHCPCGSKERELSMIGWLNHKTDSRLGAQSDSWVNFVRSAIVWS